MKSLKVIIVVFTLALFVISCKNEKAPEVKTVEVAVSNKTKELDPNANYAKAEFTIDGMTCAHGCAKTIEKKIAKMEGVKSAKVDFDKRLAMVEYDDAKVTPISLTETVTNVASIYKVSDMKTVNTFTSKKGCAEDCKKECCANKTEAEKKACAADCKKECCASKA